MMEKLIIWNEFMKVRGSEDDDEAKMKKII